MDMSKNRYRNKAPYSNLHPDARHWTRKGNSWKQKIGYDTDWQEMVNLHNTIAFEKTKDHDWSAKVPDSLKERVNNFLCRDFYQKYNIKEGGL